MFVFRERHKKCLLIQICILKDVSSDMFRPLHKVPWAWTDLTQMLSRACASPGIAGVPHQTRHAYGDYSQESHVDRRLVAHRPHCVYSCANGCFLRGSLCDAIQLFCRLSSLITKLNSWFCVVLHLSHKSRRRARPCRVQLPAAYPPHSQCQVLSL